VPYWDPVPFGGRGQGLAEYGSAGVGGRTPVVWQAPDPRTHAPQPRRAPVVAVVDTGIGVHPWFPEDDPDVERWEPLLDDLVVDGRDTGVIDELTGAIGPLAGHGTFIAGVVRQRSPRARLLSVPVLGADGVVEEYLVHTALRRILHRQQEALRSGDVDSLVDVVCLSMGYYDEDGDDSRPDSPLARLLRALAEAGVAVVAAAGNSAVDDPFYPAALARPRGAAVPDSGPTPIRARAEAGVAVVAAAGNSAVDDPFYPAALALPRGAAVPDSGPPPIVSVGARNPDNTSVALFTNDGPWVTTHRPGAAIVSTVP